MMLDGFTVRMDLEPLESSALSERFPARQIANAQRLLRTLDFDPARENCDEVRRFRLFDRLSKVAFANALAAEESEGVLAQSHLDYATVAQCAMELLSGSRPFSPSVIAAGLAETAAESRTDAES